MFKENAILVRVRELNGKGRQIYLLYYWHKSRKGIFGPIGIGGRGDEVLTIGYDELSMVSK